MVKTNKEKAVRCLEGVYRVGITEATTVAKENAKFKLTSCKQRKPNLLGQKWLPFSSPDDSTHLAGNCREEVFTFY